jgi:radical SAM superfamily enzyme YgiQ (UPF0313 family)
MRVASPVDKDVDHPQFFDPCYPLKYLQAQVQRYEGVRIDVLDCWVHPMDQRAMRDHVARLKPDLLVTSASSFDVPVADELVGTLKRDADAPLVVGIGQGYYLNHEQEQEVRASYDAILLGEPEEEFVRLFDRMRDDAGKDGQWRRHYHDLYLAGERFLVHDPDALPFPSYTPGELRAYRSIFPVRVPRRVVWGYIIGMRGCPHNCVFCSEVMRVSVGKGLRMRSAANVADEFEHMARQGVNIVSFQDDSFSASTRFVKEVCRELIARGSRMPWMARVRVDELDRPTLELMKEAGCVLLGIGVESGSQRMIDAMKKTRRTDPWPDLCRQVFRWTRELGIGTNAYYVIGNPTETREEIEQTIRLALELNSDSIQVHFYTPYPGSEAWEQYKDKLGNHDASEMFHYAAPLVQVADVSTEELERLRSQFYRRYIFRPLFMLGHLWRLKGFYLCNPDIFMSLVGIRKVF